MAGYCLLSPLPTRSPVLNPFPTPTSSSFQSSPLKLHYGIDSPLPNIHPLDIWSPNEPRGLDVHCDDAGTNINNALTSTPPSSQDFPESAISRGVANALSASQEPATRTIAASRTIFPKLSNFPAESPELRKEVRFEGNIMQYATDFDSCLGALVSVV